MKTFKINISASERDVEVLRKTVEEFHTVFDIQKRPLKMTERTYDGITNTICEITGFVNTEMVYYFGWQVKMLIDLIR